MLTLLRSSPEGERVLSLVSRAGARPASGAESSSVPDCRFFPASNPSMLSTRRCAARGQPSVPRATCRAPALPFPRARQRQFVIPASPPGLRSSTSSNSRARLPASCRRFAPELRSLSDEGGLLTGDFAPTGARVRRPPLPTTHGDAPLGVALRDRLGGIQTFELSDAAQCLFARRREFAENVGIGGFGPGRSPGLRLRAPRSRQVAQALPQFLCKRLRFETASSSVRVEDAANASAETSACNARCWEPQAGAVRCAGPAAGGRGWRDPASRMPARAFRHGATPSKGETPRGSR